MRHDGRNPDDLRPVRLTPHFLDFAAGSCLIELGRTRVLCAASVDERVPGWLKGRGRGWVTAEYSMLPASTSERTPREVSRGRPSGRTMEIQRLVGRSLRMCMDLERLGERQVRVDCDVLQADAGTRTAAVTGGYVALALALRGLQEQGALDAWPVVRSVAAVSAALVQGQPVLDPDYVEDSAADVDMNFVLTGDGQIVEIQGTAEAAPFESEQLSQLLALARSGVAAMTSLQKQALGGELGA